MAKSSQAGKPSVKIPLDFIYADYEFNARKPEEGKEEYGDIDKLAKQIKADGQLSPVLVREIPKEEMLEGQRETYELVFGFRRMAAMRLLGRDSIMAQIWEGDEIDMAFVNLAENVTRKNLKPWEKAQRYSLMKDNYELSGSKIASRLGENKGHVNNLIRIYEQGHPEIVKLWKEGHAKAGTDVLARYIIKDGRSHEEQWEAWLKHCGLEEEQVGDGEDGPVNPPPSVKVKRPTTKQLENGLAALKEYDGPDYSDDIIAGMEKALRWCLGKTKTLPKIYDPC